MKSKFLFSALFLTSAFFIAGAQNIDETSTLTSGGLLAGTAGTTSVYFGAQAGKVSTASGNTFVGHWAGNVNTTGQANSFFGMYAGVNNISGGSNTFVGLGAGFNNIGSENTYVGATSGYHINNGNYNVFVGTKAGMGTGSSYNANNNTYIGNSAGMGNTGSSNIFIGKSAGQGSAGSNLLFIENSNSPTPLIWGDFNSDILKFNAKVGIGGVTTFPSTAGGVNVSAYKLIVNGGVLAKEVRVATTWADYVFEDGYNLASLKDVECFIAENGHLPNVPSAKQVEEEGIEVGQMAKIQQEKIEELTLYVIEQDKQLVSQNQKLQEQQKQIDELKALVQSLLEKK